MAIRSLEELLAMSYGDLWHEFKPYQGLALWALVIALTRTLVPRLLVAAEKKGWIPARTRTTARSAAEGNPQCTDAAKKQS